MDARSISAIHFLQQVLEEGGSGEKLLKRSFSPVAPLLSRAVDAQECDGTEEQGGQHARAESEHLGLDRADHEKKGNEAKECADHTKGRADRRRGKEGDQKIDEDENGFENARRRTLAYGGYGNGIVMHITAVFGKIRTVHDRHLRNGFVPK